MVGMLRPRLWIRIVANTAVIECLIVATAIWWYPAIVLPWEKLAILPLVGPAVPIFVLALYCLVPRHVDIRSDWIQITHGQHAVRIPRERIDTARIVQGDPPHMVLTYTTRRGESRTAEIAIAGSMDVAALRAWAANIGAAHFLHIPPP